MRKLKLRFIIPKEDESNVTGKFFRVFFENMKPVDNIGINDGKLNIKLSFEETPMEIIQAISELPFQNVEYFGLEEEEDEDDSLKDKDETTSSEVVDPNQMTIDSLLKEESSEDSNEPAESADVTNEAKASEVTDAEKEEDKKPEEGTSTNAQNKRAYSRKSEEIDEIGAKVFLEEAKKSSSFEEFVENMFKNIELTDTYKDFYLAVVDGVCAVEEFSIPAIKKYMEEHGNSFNTTGRVSVSQKIKKAFEDVGSNVRFLSFFKEISKYKNYNFGDGAVKPTDAEETDNGETNKEKLFGREPFKVLKVELVEAVKSSEDADSFSKVGIILDEIRAKNDIEFYEKNREKFIQLVLQTAEKVISGKNLLSAFNECATANFANISHMAKAYLFQSIKNYCGSTETIEEGKIAGFFDDVIRLM